MNALTMPLYPPGSHDLLETWVTNHMESSPQINGIPSSQSSYLWCFQSYGQHQESARIWISSTIFMTLSCVQTFLAHIQSQMLPPTIIFVITSDIATHRKSY